MNKVPTMKLHQKLMIWIIAFLLCYTAYRIAWGIVAFWWRGNPGSLAFVVAMGAVWVMAGVEETRDREGL